MANTASGSAGNNSVPAITSGVLGRSVSPRKAEMMMYALQRLPEFSLRNEATFSAEKAAGFDKKNPRAAMITAAQTTVSDLRMTEESFLRSAIRLSGRSPTPRSRRPPYQVAIGGQACERPLPHQDGRCVSNAGRSLRDPDLLLPRGRYRSSLRRRRRDPHGLPIP